MNCHENKRLERLYSIMEEKSLDALILTDGYNIHHLSGYRGHTGCMLIIESKKYILTDSRYTEQVSIEAPEFTCIDIGLNGYAKTICGFISQSINGLCRVGFENLHISYNQYKAFRDNFGQNVELVELEDAIISLRQIKADDEIANIAKAEHIGDQAFAHILKHVREGITEKDIALELEYTMRKLGAEGLSFDTIVASGHNSSLPHAVPTGRKLSKGDFVTMDFGCVYCGYCSDMTRTVFVGEKPSEQQELVYHTVLRAQQEALEMVRPGVKCCDVDARARDIISDAGYGAYFGHGLGHSVGLFIHEEPRLSRKCETVLEPGMVITVEPGIYLPGQYGVRIEDLIVVTEDGYQNLAASPKSLIICR